jgi:hypothetical protein
MDDVAGCRASLILQGGSIVKGEAILEAFVGVGG